MVHCGYEPTASLGIDAQPGDLWKTLRFNFGPRPERLSAAHIDPFDGVRSTHSPAPALSEPA
jgi:hypothetical protein